MGLLGIVSSGDVRLGGRRRNRFFHGLHYLPVLLGRYQSSTVKFIVFMSVYLQVFTKINQIECVHIMVLFYEEHKVLPMLAWEIGTRLELGFSKFLNWEIKEGPEVGEDGVFIQQELLISHAFSTR